MNKIKRQYIIYLITNKINGKIYIGRTTTSLKKRWSEHLACGKYWEKYYPNKTRTYLYNAMLKHSIDNFTIKEIDKANNFEEMVKMETDYILKYKSSDPSIGYNLSLGEYGDGVEHIVESTRKKMSIASHRGGGVFFDNERNKWAVFFKYLHVSIRKRVNSQNEAKEIYDKLTLYFRGDDGILHFPEKKEEYLKTDLKQFYEKIAKIKDIAQKYYGVRPDKDGYIVRINIGNNKRAYMGMYSDEKEAAMVHDKVSYYLRRNNKKINFPEAINDNYEIEGKKIFAKYTDKTKQMFRKKPKTSIYRCVNKRSTNTWEMSMQINGKRIREIHLDEISAAKSYDKYAIENGLPVEKLNFP